MAVKKSGMHEEPEESLLELILPSFYSKLLHMQVQKRKKDSQVKQLFASLGSAHIKAAHKHFDEIDPWS